jgi:hypothetical protein
MKKLNPSLKGTEIGGAEGDGHNRAIYRNLFERIKPDEKEKIKEKIDKKEIRKYIEEEENSINSQNSEINGK